MINTVTELGKSVNSANVGTKVVHVYYKECCGCGCFNIDIYYRVPADSDIKDGDILNAKDIDWANVGDNPNF